MDSLSGLIADHAAHAHWFAFGIILLAGMNIPVSIDVVVIATALIAARILPEHTLHLYLAVLFGCYFAAWIAYWVGRVLLPKVLKIPIFSKLLSPKRIEKARVFYEKHGLWALALGRFIPFGVRNCLFMSAGLSRMSFLKFICLDALACLLWCSTSFYLFYTLGHHYEKLSGSIKIFNLTIFTAFAMALIGIIWYKRMSRKRKSSRL